MTCLHRYARLSLRTFCAASTACGAVILLLVSPLNLDFHLPPFALGSPCALPHLRGRGNKGMPPISFCVKLLQKDLPIPRMRERIKLTQQGCGWKPTAACTTASQREHEQRGRR